MVKVLIHLVFNRKEDKKMKKLFGMIAMAAAIVACNKETAIQTAEQSAEKTGGIKITATLAPKGDVTKAIAENESKLKTTWTVDETLAILYEVSGTKYVADATITNVDGDTGAATISFTVEAGTPNNTSCTLVYPLAAAKDDHSGVKEASEYLATQNGTLAANLDVRVGSGTIQTSTPGLTVSTQPAPQYAIFKFTTKSGETEISVNRLSVFIDGNEYVITPASAASTLTVALPPVTGSTVGFTATGSDNKIYSCAKSSVTFVAEKYYQSVLKMKEDVLGGAFSVSTTKKVRFSKGNLTYSSGTWYFLANSWEYNTNAATDNKVGKVDGSQHFNWGTVFQSGTSGESAVISDITTALGSGWSALSLAEWRYLLGYDGNNGGTQSSKRTVQWHYYAMITSTASIGTGNKRYLLIFPDDFQESYWNESSMGTKPTSGFDGTSESSAAYTESNFTAMQAAGIVILPAAGYRIDSSWNNVGNGGIYWSSTSYSTSGAYYLFFGSSSVYVSYNSKTYCYFPVRLVQNI